MAIGKTLKMGSSFSRLLAEGSIRALHKHSQSSDSYRAIMVHVRVKARAEEEDS